MKTKLSKTQLEYIIELFNKDLGSRQIASIMGVNRSTIIRAYKQLNLPSVNKKCPRTAYKALEKCCKICKQTKLISEFRKRTKGTRISYESYCLNCEKEYSKTQSNKRYKNNKIWYKQYRINNLDKIKEYDKIYREENKNILKIKRNLNKDNTNKRLRFYYKNKRANDASFKLRSNISHNINYYLKKNGSSKLGKSCIKYLEYTMNDLKIHLESLFEPWMNWKNWGNYDPKTWDDNNKSTWKWSLDHIIPQSTLLYKTMDEPNFKKCWALSNLRPYSAKQNLLDGSKRTRHNLI